MSPEHVSSISREQDVVESDSKLDTKDGMAGAIEELRVEEGEAHKTFYSKGSVIMMVIFSGLAIGSDG
jgi:putative component of toxin-antitoxin plasmid stabilization module